MSGNSYELVYFPIIGLGNMVRILLEDQSIPYKFKTAEFAKWKGEVKPQTPLGQLPMLIVNSKTKLGQSHTIVRYLARMHGLMGSNELEAAQIEMYIDQTIDVRKQFLTMIYSNYEQGLKPFIASIPEMLAPFDKKLSEGDKKHLLFGKLTAIDYVLYDLILALNALSPGCLDKTPNAKAFFESFGKREKLRAFMDKPDIKAMKFTASGHL